MWEMIKKWFMRDAETERYNELMSQVGVVDCYGELANDEHEDLYRSM